MLAPGERAQHRIVEALGARVRLDDGRELIDAKHMAPVLGHCHPELVSAVEKAAARPFVDDAGASREREEAAAALLDTALAGEEWPAAVRFTMNASDANDIALLLAQVLTQRTPLAARVECYHGAVGLARDVTTHRFYHGGLAGPSGDLRLPPRSPTEVRTLPPPGRLSPPEVESALNGAAALITDFGLQPTGPEEQDLLAAVASDRGALWIQDEAVTGFGRSGRWFAFQQAGSRPDIMTLGKGISGGAVPAGALVVSRRVLELLEDGRWHNVSGYRGHPLTVGAVRATVEVLARDGLVERAAELGRGLHREFANLAARHPSVRSITGEGLIWNIALEGDETNGAWRGEGADTPPAARLLAAALEHGVLLGGHGGAAATVSPPLVVTAGELEQVVEGIDHALAAVDDLVGAVTQTTR
jgi:4-aminobutyrate aminotransferase-like enzyme